MTRHQARNLTTSIRKAIGALAVSTAAYSDVVDLGEKFSFTKLVAIKRGTASTSETLIIEVSHDNSAWVTAPNLAMTGLVSSPSSGDSMVVAGIPSARYARVKFTNGSGAAQTALVLELVALEG
ncbi:hypothetical protein SAMN02949497_3523 [Methylomagnum ishizawai]|uniref:F5/8 type C domain-containing protein n=1 Tax=Methylomagnum ishizawai TaxID=1760988 RepID=A0A1Y6CZM7_9GAMM|nr:hypothetical protein [Methylomagnum ishizawai]SMF96138.1 hypothetical protein SAMN02949497_3523 [Methylomagnum ishizawai]